MNPPSNKVHRSPTTITASGLIGARPFHQPVLSIQVYIEVWPFSCKRNKEESQQGYIQTTPEST